MEILEFIARYIWPAVMVWNVYLFKEQRSLESKQADLKLYLAQNYTSKQDLEAMFKAQQRWLDDKLEYLKK